MKNEGLKCGLKSVDSSDYQMSESGDSGVIEEEAAKEWEHTLLQDSMDKELHELNKRLEQKESEMRLFEGFDTMTLKQHFGKKIMKLEDEKRVVQISNTKSPRRALT
ncbi:kinesin-like protein KIN-4A isoform X2 [Rutidosis leptorrhynchoides]|uniref:kinesin-like protein KIN-4A isoform X2 n=1 Tax=Rutidosis leptorrhynchoides TaxID=125765 RepID=UPI003A993C01